MPASRFALIAFALLIATAPRASACSCGGISGRTAWDIAEKASHTHDLIFEGSLVRSAIEWDILNTRNGDSIRPAPMGSENPENNQPRMVVTFRVKSFYKGVGLGPEIQVRTGFGGGDCGAQFATGLEYLVYAYRSASDRNVLWVSSCGPGNWIQSNSIAPQLRYLRKQAPLKSDLATLKRKTEEVERNEWKEFAKHYDAATGQICGVVTPSDGARLDGRAEVRFESVSGYSPRGPSAEIDQEGKFCSGRLGPGDYYLHFVSWSHEGEPRSSVYFPGVVDRVRATTLKVGAGKVLANLKLQVPKQKGYTIRGFLSRNITSSTGQNNNTSLVYLFGLDGQIWGSQEVDFQNPLPLPKVKYFVFENILPGRYIAFASCFSSGQYTKIAHLQVTSNGKLIFLELKDRN
jgi:hypothetical protein